MIRAKYLALWRKACVGVLGVVLMVPSGHGMAYAKQTTPGSSSYRIAQSTVGDGSADFVGVFGALAALGWTFISSVVQNTETMYNDVVRSLQLDCTNKSESCTHVINPHDPVQMGQFLRGFNRVGGVCQSKTNRVACQQAIQAHVQRRADEQVIASLLTKERKSAYVQCRARSVNNSVAKCISAVTKTPIVLEKVTPSVKLPSDHKRPDDPKPSPTPQLATDGASGRDGGTCSVGDIQRVRDKLIEYMKIPYTIVPQGVRADWNAVHPRTLDAQLRQLLQTVWKERTSNMEQALRQLGVTDVQVTHELVVVTCKGKRVHFKMYAKNSKSTKIEDIRRNNFFQRVLR